MGLDVAAVRQAEPLALNRQRLVEEWVATYGDGVLKLAYLWLKDRHQAEDVFQEVFTKVYLHAHAFRGEASPKTWLYRITVNLCRDKLRAWATRKVVLLGEELLSAARNLGQAEQDDDFGAVDSEVLLQAVLQLPLEYSEVIVLTYYEDLDVATVARTLDVPAGTVRSRLHRARLRLKTLLLEGGWDA